MKTERDYKVRLSACMRAAGLGDTQWGQRFKRALDVNALQLSTVPPPMDADRYPSGYAYTAPRPFPMDSDEWPPDTYVVWQP